MFYDLYTTRRSEGKWIVYGNVFDYRVHRVGDKERESVRERQRERDREKERETGRDTERGTERDGGLRRLMEKNKR